MLNFGGQKMGNISKEFCFLSERVRVDFCDCVEIGILLASDFILHILDAVL